MEIFFQTLVGGLSLGAIYALVAIAVSVLVFTRFEEPAREWLKRRL